MIGEPALCLNYKELNEIFSIVGLPKEIGTPLKIMEALSSI